MSILVILIGLLILSLVGIMVRHEVVRGVRLHYWFTNYTRYNSLPTYDKMMVQWTKWTKKDWEK